MDEKVKLICQYKRATFDYEIIQTYEAGIVLYGTEIKSLRQNGGNFIDPYCEIKNNECFVRGFHISPYSMGNIFNHDSDRLKKLLLNKNEILKLSQKRAQEGYTIIPLKAYFAHGLVKIMIAVVRGKKLYDKREDKKKEDQERYIKKYQ